MAGKLVMGQKDLLRGKEMELVKQKKQTVKAAGVKLKVSYRQAKRVYAAYLKGGDAGLIHGNAGKKSNHKIQAETRESVLRTYQERYDDFGPTFAAEKLAEVEGIKVSVSTVRGAGCLRRICGRESGSRGNTAAAGTGAKALES